MKDIKSVNTFEEVQEIRRRQVQVEKVGGDHEGIQRILTEDMYKNPLRFIDELLQNAQDASRKAKKEISVEFRLYNDKLVFCHSGKEFDLQDIINITGIGVSTKRDEDIGVFGIGFKSVYYITNEPHIYSGEYQFKISEFRIPYRVPENNNIKETEIVLPFKTETEVEQEKIYSYFNEIKSESLIFLPNIEAITWFGNREEHRKNCLSKEILDELADDNLVFKKIAITNTLSDRSKHYLVFQRIIHISGKELNIEIAFGFDTDKNEFIPLKNNKLYVYFPTEEETHLNFLLNAPFRTTANRANIKLEKDKDFTILEELSQLAADSVLFIKKHYPHLLNSHFYSKIIPLNGEEKNIFYKCIFEKIKELLINPERKLLPTQNSDFASAINLLLAENSSLIELLDNKDIKKLFGKEYWITTEITSTKKDTKDLYIYLKEHLDIKEIGFENFAKEFTAEFISTKDDSWVKMFYKILLNNSKRLWEKDPWEIKYSYQNQTDGIWKTKPIIRIIRMDNEEHISPYDEHGKRKAWLPSKTTSYFDTVKPTLIEDEDTKKFLTALRLKKPDLLAEFTKYIAPKYTDENLEIEKENYLKDLYKAIETYEEVKKDSNKRDQFINTIKSLQFIKAENVSTGNKLFKKPEEVYFSTEELRIWFQSNKEVYFVEDIYKDFNAERKGLNDFFSAIGVSKEIRFFFKPQFYRMKEHYCSPRHRYHDIRPNNFDPKFDVDGLSHALDNIDMERSKIIWDKAVNKFSHLITAKIKSAKFQRCLRGHYDKNKPEEIPKEKRITSIAGKLLREKYWLYDTNKKLIQKPNSKISFEDLHDGYDKNHENINKLVKSLGLQPDTFTKEEVNKILQKKDEEIEKLKRELNKYKKTESREKPQRGYNLNELPSKGIPETEVLPENDGRDLIGLEEQDHIKDGSDIDKNKEMTGNDHVREERDSHADTKEYGIWAEEYVVKELKEKYKGEENIIIEWLNEKVEKGKGCDIIIKKDNEPFEFIEVKGKVSNKPEFFEVTDMQFRFAQKEGDKFFFYIVSNVKSDEIKIDRLIKNPIKLWKENKLPAYPVRFKL